MPFSLSEMVVEKKNLDINKVVYSSIERCNFGTLKHPNNKLCLLLCFSNGIQIWDLSSSESNENHDFQQIFSLKNNINQIRLIKFLPPPELEDDEKSPFHQKRPIVLLASDLKIFFFSLKTNSEVEMDDLKFGGKIISIFANPSNVLFSTKNKIYLFESNNFKLIEEKEIFESPEVPIPPIAFGKRWYAIPSPILIPEIHKQVLEEKIEQQKNDPKKNNSGNSSISFWTNTLYNWGDMGREKLQNYIYDQKEENPTSGIVQIFDSKTLQNISHFKAHKHKLTNLAFDNSETLLVTSSDGHNINVFRIHPANSPYTSHIHIYSMRRGFTNAKIHTINFTDDSRWISISTARGTNRKRKKKKRKKY